MLINVGSDVCPIGRVIIVFGLLNGVETNQRVALEREWRGSLAKHGEVVGGNNHAAAILRKQWRSLVGDIRPIGRIVVYISVADD